MTHDAKLRDKMAIGYTVEKASKPANAIFDANTFGDFFSGWCAKAKHEDEKVMRLVDVCNDIILKCGQSIPERLYLELNEALKEFEK